MGLKLWLKPCQRALEQQKCRQLFAIHHHAWSCKIRTQHVAWRYQHTYVMLNIPRHLVFTTLLSRPSQGTANAPIHHSAHFQLQHSCDSKHTNPLVLAGVAADVPCHRVQMLKHAHSLCPAQLHFVTRIKNHVHADQGPPSAGVSCLIVCQEASA